MGKEQQDEGSPLVDQGAEGASSAVFSTSHGAPRVDDRRILSGIIFVNRNGLRWRDAPAEYGSPTALYDRWSENGIFARMLLGLVAQGDAGNMLMVDATHPKVHRTAVSLRLKEGASDARLAGRRAA